MQPGLGSPLPHLRRDWAHPCHICAGTWIVRSPFRQQEARRVGSGSGVRGGRCNSAHVPIRWAVRAEPAGGGKRAGACSHPLGCRGTLRWARHRTAEDTPNEQANKQAGKRRNKQTKPGSRPSTCAPKHAHGRGWRVASLPSPMRLYRKCRCSRRTTTCAQLPFMEVESAIVSNRR